MAHVAHGVEAVQPGHRVEAELPEALGELAQRAGAQLRSPPPEPPLDRSRRQLRLLTQLLRKAHRTSECHAMRTTEFIIRMGGFPLKNFFGGRVD